MSSDIDPIDVRDAPPPPTGRETLTDLVRNASGNGISFEGVGIAIFFIALLAMGAWERIEPIMARVAPGIFATRHGPKQFPVIVRIRQSGLTVTNGSSGEWRCRFAIGAPLTDSIGPYLLAPGASTDVLYSMFRIGSTSLSDASGYARARSLIQVHCMDNANVVHSVLLN